MHCSLTSMIKLANKNHCDGCCKNALAIAHDVEAAKNTTDVTDADAVDDDDDDVDAVDAVEAVVPRPLRPLWFS